MKKAYAIVLLFACVYNIGLAQGNLKTYGVQINVTNWQNAIAFYHGVLGFEIAANDTANGLVLLHPKTGNERLFLHKVNYLLPVADNEERASLTLQVNNLDSAVASLKSKGIDFGRYQKRKEGVGYAVYVDDPFGTRLSLMQETVVNNPHFTEPRIYNWGFYIPAMDTAIRFFTTLGFPLRSQKYLPQDAPLNNPDGSFGFMLHTRKGVEAVHYNDAANEHLVLLFRTPDIEQAVEMLKAKGGKLVTDRRRETALGKIVLFYDPFGYISILLEIKE